MAMSIWFNGQILSGGFTTERFRPQGPLDPNPSQLRRKTNPDPKFAQLRRETKPGSQIRTTSSGNQARSPNSSQLRRETKPGTHPYIPLPQSSRPLARPLGPDPRAGPGPCARPEMARAAGPGAGNFPGPGMGASFLILPIWGGFLSGP